MKILVSTFFILISFHCFSQVDSTTMDIHQSISASDAFKILESINSDEGLIKTVEAQCPNFLDSKLPLLEDEKTEAVCFAQEEMDPADYQTFKVRTEIENVPDQIKQHIPGEMFENPKKMVTIVLSTPNDNKGLGLWGLISESDGDDFGFSHGQTLDLGYTTLQGTNFTLSAGSNVFTRQIGEKFYETNDKGERDSIYPQQFTNENAVNFMMSTAPKNKLQYFKAGIGWIQLDQKNTDKLFSGSNIQQGWHNTWKHMYKFENHSIDNVETGFNMQAFFGLQKNLMSKNSYCRLKTNIEVGGNISTLNDDYFQGSASTILYMQKPGKKTAFNIGLSAASKIHTDGTEYMIGLTTGYVKKRFGVSLNLTQQYGDLHNYQYFNTPNADGKIESIMTIKTRIILGKISR